MERRVIVGFTGDWSPLLLEKCTYNRKYNYNTRYCTYTRCSAYTIDSQPSGRDGEMKPRNSLRLSPEKDSKLRVWKTAPSGG